MHIEYNNLNEELKETNTLYEDVKENNNSLSDAALNLRAEKDILTIQIEHEKNEGILLTQKFRNAESEADDLRKEVREVQEDSEVLVDFLKNCRCSFRPSHPQHFQRQNRSSRGRSSRGPNHNHYRGQRNGRVALQSAYSAVGGIHTVFSAFK